MFTTSFDATLPADFIRSCRTISLSKVAFNATKSLPKQLWMSEKVNFYTMLALCLTSLPPATVAQCDSLPEGLRPLLFNLAVLHTATAMAGSSSTRTSFEQSHLSLLIGCVDELLVLMSHGPKPRTDTQVVLEAVTAHTREVYSCCLSQHMLEGLVRTCLSEEATKPSAHIKLQALNVDLTVPSQAVPPRMFHNHAMGLDTAQTANYQHLRYMYIHDS